MMRSPKSFVVAVRRPDQSIAVREQPWAALVPFLRFLRWPLFRGALVLLESLHNGFSALKFSAENAIVPAEKEPGRGSSELPTGLFLCRHNRVFGGKLQRGESIVQRLEQHQR